MADDTRALRPRAGFAIPVAQLVLFAVLAVVVGVVGAIVPARRAARLDILQAVSAGE